jgi:hypothetical protein
MKNLDEFLEKTKPGAKKSKLYEFLPELKSLREKNYTLGQLREFLKGNGVVVSIPWLSAFLRTHSTHSDAHSQKAIGKLLSQSHATKPAPVSPAATVGGNPLRVLSGKPKEGEHSAIPLAKFEVDNT